MPKLLTTAILLCCIFPSPVIFAQGNTNQGSPEILYVDKVNTLDDLFAKFKGQVIYVDYWGSWCSSCLDEFKPNPELDAFIKANKIVRLYLALEKETKDPAMEQASREKWKSMVEKYNLAGYNYYAQLKSDFFRGITEKIMKGKLSLPRYSIIDKNGVIVNRDAKSPSNFSGLKKQLSDYLKEGR